MGADVRDPRSKMEKRIEIARPSEIPKLLTMLGSISRRSDQRRQRAVIHVHKRN